MSLRRSSSVRPCDGDTGESHTVAPSARLTASTRPLSKPEIAMSRATTGAAVPRSVRRGICCSVDQTSLPSASASARSLPSTVRTMTSFSATAGAERISPFTSARQRSAPLAAASATTWPSAEPTATMSPPTPVPPASSSLVSTRHSCLPVFRSNAATSPSRPAANRRSSARGETQPQAQLLAAAAHAGAPELLDCDRRVLDVGELGRLVDLLVLRIAGREREQRAASSTRLRFFIRISVLRFFRDRRRRAAQVADLQIEQFGVDAARCLRAVRAARYSRSAPARSPLASSTSPRVSARRGANSPAFVDLERGERVVVFALRGLHARQAQARDQLDFVVRGGVHHGLETRGGLVEFIRIDLDPRGDQRLPSGRIGRPGVFAVEFGRAASCRARLSLRVNASSSSS